MTNFHLTSLGCPKNLVDSQRLGAELERLGLAAAASPGRARVVIVNTCGFIREACEESLETILALSRLKGKGRLLVVAGCLSGRYGATLEGELPEVDLFFGPLTTTAAVRQAAAEIAAAVGVPGGAACAEALPFSLSPPHRAYVKVAEGCSNRCTYCTIPSIRGRRRSRPPQDILDEVAALAQRGVREVTLVAQDTSAYGADLRPRTTLAGLLENLGAQAAGPDWVRLLYLHPARVDTRLIAAMTAGGRILPYFDLPVQHASRQVLGAMGRGYDAARLLRLIEKIRQRCPEAVLRTSLMVGFPGEGAREFGELVAFVRQAAFDHLGCFVFSPEEGTPAATLRPRVSRKVAERRKAEVMALQAEISRSRNEALVGRVLPVLVEEARRDSFVGRAARHAPEIDGQVLGKGRAGAGQIVPVRVTAASDYDLVARLMGCEPHGLVPPP
jgi:ribosomal protein S12 methylthiotransferase